jgi:hypothetical protein
VGGLPFSSFLVLIGLTPNFFPPSDSLPTNFFPFIHLIIYLDKYGTCELTYLVIVSRSSTRLARAISRNSFVCFAASIFFVSNPLRTLLHNGESTTPLYSIRYAFFSPRRRVYPLNSTLARLSAHCDIQMGRVK